ncbi:LytR/AlgR family response regulator transcription factor [Emticicia agri]|uniref:LytTR family transcriptional regulator n=1 Tax=Emticicia agri TaxID=2492393 RepID=A0A4Q5M3Z8_9BACT|nr:LytTR family DNA-binding domain-containing protein [Emticicia agri]RYU97068.1 LytTR family transcriptional regulator [Emticicia agri]
MKTLTAFAPHYTLLSGNKLYRTALKAIFLLNTLSVLLTYLFDFASCHLCYLKLVIIFCTNALFWMGAFPFMIERVALFQTNWRKMVIFGATVVCLNQALVVLAWVGIIGTFYDCLKLDFIPPLVLQNNILMSVLSFSLIVGCVYFTNLNKKTTPEPDKNLATAQINYLKNVSVKNGTLTTLIPVEKIYAIEADDNTIEFKTQMGKFISYQSLKSIETQLDPELFGRIYRSTIVNKTYIKKIRSLSSGDAVVSLDNGEELKMSRHYKAQFNNGTNLQ